MFEWVVGEWMAERVDGWEHEWVGEWMWRCMDG